MKKHILRFMFLGSTYTKDVVVELSNEDFAQLVTNIQVGIANKEPFTIRGKAEDTGIVLNLAHCLYLQWE